MSNDPTPVLYCFRDHIPMRPDIASCLHPSSFCSYRDFCLIYHKDRGGSPPSSDDDPWSPRRQIPNPDSSSCA